MKNIIAIATNWKIFVPVLGVALIIGAVIYNSNTASDLNTTPEGETTAAEAQDENVEVEVEAATLDNITETQETDNTSSDNTEK